MGGEGVTICVKLDGDLARWLRRVSKSLPYSEEEVIIHLLKSFRDTWLLVENAMRNESRARWLDQVAKYRWLVLEFMKWLGGRQLASASIDDAKAFLNARGVTNWNTFNTYLQALRHAIILAKTGVDLEKILNTGRNKS